ncbi:FAD-dependent oxidoreductase [Asticcacaulis sp. YBE204]|uniref:flavin monoamine oxidase family protein n=1 Tax=Asticcacaulis sp. YBE204 TaxID=1282363 RepID=UPI0003C3C390|nr:FAD-dependent oxidoreductase [Asticcacaulis sp. YBE204]ESQ79782.1 hypothetical protein AEYBE204_08025 [Asticcacaulis sp. YBE204]
MGLDVTTRRDILMRFGAVAGTAGAYAAMHALGLSGSEAWAGTPDLQPGSGKGVRVIILGAGVAGMSAAYELRKAGYDCLILEARTRAGGRNFTVRKGTVIDYGDGTTQTCAFDEGHYFNAGPARIPSHHQATLGYCREFGIAMETEVNWSGTARIQTDRLNGGKAFEMRQAIFDFRGHMAELLAKVAKKGALDDKFSSTDRDQLIAGLGQWGGLGETLTYDGCEGAGFEIEPAAGKVRGQHRKPLPMSVVGDPFVQGMAGFADLIDMQATMQQPVGGMDRIPAAFEAHLPGVIRFGCEVKRLRKKGKGVEVYYLDKAAGTPQVAVADYCISTLPLPVMNRIDSDLSKPVKAAIARNAVIGDGYKIAFQGPRFWETEAHIYGGLSFTDRETFITWYPSNGFHQPEGVLVAGYNFNGDMGKRSFPDQVAYARDTIERLHPGRSGLLRAPISMHWGRAPYSQGLASQIAFDDPTGYDLLSQPDGPIYFAGDYMSYVTAWQQGAFCSAHRVVNMIADRQKSLKA